MARCLPAQWATGMAARTSASIFILTVIVVAVAGCGSTSTSVLAPTPPTGRCSISLDVSSSSFSASGGTGTLRVNAARECAWAILARPPWVTLTATPNSQGALELTFSVVPNRSTESRSGEVVIADERVRISQEAATCDTTIAPAQFSLASSGGEATARLTTEDFCTWDVASPHRWIAASPERGQGTADIKFTVLENSGDKRRATVRVGAVTVEIEQREAPPPPTAPRPPQRPSPDPAPAPVPEPTPPAPAPPSPMPPSPLPPAPQPTPPPATPPPAPVPPAPPPPAPQPPPPPATPPPVPVPPPAPVPPPSPAPQPPPPATPPPVPVPPPTPVPPQPACTYSVSPLRFEVGRKSRRVEISVVTQPSCELRVTSDAVWVEVSPTLTTGSGKVVLEIDENRGERRTARISLSRNGFTATVVVVQEGSRKPRT